MGRAAPLIRRLARTTKTHLRRRRRIVYAMIVAVLFFTAAEITARVANWVGRPQPGMPGAAANLETSIIDDAQLFWRLKPNQDMEGDGRIYRINALGLRDGEIVVPKPAATYRILSLGESTTFGAGVELDETYAKVAERLLRQARPNVEVVNAGVGAYTSFQCVKYLELHGAQLAPDEVWLFSGANDGLASYARNYKNLRHGFGYTDKELYAIRNRYAGLLNLLNRSDLYKLLRRWQTRRALDDYGEQVAGQETILQQQPVWQPRVPEADRRENLRRFVEICRGLGARPVFLLPAYWNSPPDAKDVMREVAQSTASPLVDLPRALHDSGRFADCWLDLEEFGGHPNALGHRLMGEAIAAALIVD
jgi:lysophospholipase L1-like esterase